MRPFAPVVLGSLLVLSLLPGAPAAHEYTSHGITVAHPWARATPGGVKIGGAYFEMKAAAGRGDRLIAVLSAVAGNAELHSHTMEGGVARMRRLVGT